jgi:L-threonate 2-dehydrogenase
MNTTATARDAVFSLGIVGVGNMGGATAANLLARGWPVRVNDLDASKTRNLESFGAVSKVSGAQLAIKSEAVIVCMVDAAHTEDVLFDPHGVLAGLRAGGTVLLCPRWARTTSSASPSESPRAAYTRSMPPCRAARRGRATAP